MSDIYLAAMLSALSYGVANAGSNINDIKANYINKTGEESAVHWGSNYTNSYLYNIKVIKTYDTGTLYIKNDHLRDNFVEKASDQPYEVWAMQFGILWGDPLLV